MIFPSNTKWLERLAPDSLGSILLPLLLLFSANLNAAEEADPSVALRKQLRDVMIQLRTAQTDSANAQVAKTAAEQKIGELETSVKALETRNARLVKESADGKTAADESIAKLKNALADRDKRIIEYQEALAKWKDGYEKAAAIARTKEDERATLASQVIVNKRDIADLQRKNIALFNISNEILDRYEGYALGKALAAREPFIGTTRVKVENLVQGYKDKILDNRIAAPAKP